MVDAVARDVEEYAREGERLARAGVCAPGDTVQPAVIGQRMTVSRWFATRASGTS